MAPPETASDGSKIQVIAHKNHFYVLKTSVSPLAVRVCEHFDLQVPRPINCFRDTVHHFHNHA